MDEASKPLVTITVGPLGFYKCDHMPLSLAKCPSYVPEADEDMSG